MPGDADLRLYLDINGDGVAGPPSGNQISNGDFSTDATGWAFDAGIVNSVSGGKLRAYRNGGSDPGFHQDFSYPATSGDTFEVSVKLANTSSTEKTITAWVRDATSYTGGDSESVVIPASTSEYTETLTFAVTGDWTSTRLEFLIVTDDNDAELTFDDISITVTDNIDNITQYLRNGSAAVGITDAASRMCETGELAMTVDNSERQFSPNYSSGAFYGKLKPGRAMMLAVVISAVTTVLWTGKLSDINPLPLRFGDQLAELVGHTRIRDYQDTEDISFPVQQDKRPDELYPLVDAAVYQSGAATATLTFDGVPTDEDTITLGSRTYTLEDTLGLNANEVKINSRRYDTVDSASEDYADDTALSLVAAINGDDNDSASYYSNETTPHGSVVATVEHPGIGWPSGQDTGHDLNNSATNKSHIACYINFRDEDIYTNIQTIRVWLKKTGSPTGTLTGSLRYSSGSGTVLDGALVHPSATATVAEASLSTSYGWIDFTFSEPITIDAGGNYFLFRLETDRSADASNYVTWGAEASAASIRTIGFYWDGSWNTVTDSFLLWIPPVVTIRATEHGAQGNLAISTTSSVITLSGAAMTGGAQPTAFTPAYEVSDKTFDYAGDTWEGRVNAMTAIEEINASVYGFFAIDKAGNPVSKDTAFQFEALAQTPITIDNTMSAMEVRYTLDDIVNRSRVEYRTRTVETDVRIGGRDQFRLRRRPSFGDRGDPRWAAYQARPTSDKRHVRTVTIDARSNATGKAVGVLRVAPPILGTHYTLNSDPDGNGENITARKPRISWAIRGATVDVTFTNRTTRKMYVLDFYLDGDIIRYDEPQYFVSEDATSIATYGVREGDPYEIPLPVDESFAVNLSDFLAQVRKDPRMIVETVEFNIVEYAGSVNLLTVDLFDVLAVQEYQTAFDRPCIVVGIEYEIDAESLTTVLFHVRQIEVDYFILDSATYGVLDQNVLSL